MTETKTAKRPYDHMGVAFKLTDDLHERGVDADSVSKEEATRLIREECAARGMHEPPTAVEWSLAQVWCNALMMVDVAFGDCNDPKWRETPEGNYIGHVAGVIAEHLGDDTRPVEYGIAFLDQVRDHARCDHHPIETRDTEVRREYEGYEPTREQCMLGATLANALKALGLAPRHDDLHPLHWTSPLDDSVRVPDATIAARVAAVVSAWQGGYHQTLADAKLLLQAALDACKA